uniref:Thyroglobulin type-1 domain-containing protein n=1 Tax=Anisakis simplex TaxID=6269 RepID=A0A0M3JMY8_ANISI
LQCSGIEPKRPLCGPLAQRGLYDKSVRDESVLCHFEGHCRRDGPRSKPAVMFPDEPQKNAVH